MKRLGMSGATPMMSATLPLTFDEFEARSYSVLADASKTIVKMAQQSRVVTHYQILSGLTDIVEDMRSLLDIFHTAEMIPALENATPEQLENVPTRMRDVHGKIEQTISIIRSKKLGYWKRLYDARVEKLETYNCELDSHVYALSESQSSVLLLTRRDQDRILESLANPPKANDALRRAFTRK